MNQVMEWRADLQMRRTRLRPIPRGDLSPAEGWIFGGILVAIGLLIMYGKISSLMALGAAVTGFLYLAIYTPLKKITWLNTLIGAIPGALPPVGGWLAATGQLDFQAWILFALLFFWQQPHFYIIAWIYQSDYERSPFEMLPSVKSIQGSTFFQMGIYSIFTVATSILLYKWTSVQLPYLIGATLVGAWFLFETYCIWHTRTHKQARRFLKATVFYLPLLFTAFLLDLLTPSIIF